MYENKANLAKMIEIVKKNMLNLFEGTDPNHNVLGDNKGMKSIKITKTLQEKDLESATKQLK